MPGHLSDPDKVIVDVGTGYFVEKVRCAYLTQSRADARKLYKDKIDFVAKNMEQLQETIHRKQDNLRVVGELLQVVRHCAHMKRSCSSARALRAQPSHIDTASTHATHTLHAPPRPPKGLEDPRRLHMSSLRGAPARPSLLVSEP